MRPFCPRKHPSGGVPLCGKINASLWRSCSHSRPASNVIRELAVCSFRARIARKSARCTGRRLPGARRCHRVNFSGREAVGSAGTWPRGCLSQLMSSITPGKLTGSRSLHCRSLVSRYANQGIYSNSLETRDLPHRKISRWGPWKFGREWIPPEDFRLKLAPLMPNSRRIEWPDVPARDLCTRPSREVNCQVASIHFARSLSISANMKLRAISSKGLTQACSPVNACLCLTITSSGRVMRLERIAREVLLQDLWSRSIELCPVYLIIVAEEQ